MKNLDLNAMGVVEMDAGEMKVTNGGEKSDVWAAVGLMAATALGVGLIIASGGTGLAVVGLLGGQAIGVGSWIGGHLAG